MNRSDCPNRAASIGLLLLLPLPLWAATVTWDGGADDGSWHSAVNWSGDIAPGPGDDVVVPADKAVTVLESVTVKSLKLGNRATLGVSGAGIVFEADTAAIDGANLWVAEGGRINLPGLVAYQNTDATGGGGQLSASGVGSVLDLPGLTKLASNLGGISVSAGSGGEVRMPALSQVIQGSVTFSAYGGGSRIDLSGMVRFTGGSFSVGDDGLISADALERFNSSYLEIAGPNSLSLPALADLDLSEISLRGGAQWSPPSRITSYRPGGYGLRAADAGTVLDLSGITTLTDNWAVADRGGEIRLSAVLQLEGGTYSATGEGSLIDLSALTRITGGTFEVGEGGKIIADALQRFNGGTLNVAGPSALPLPSLQDFNSSSVALSKGASWSPPAGIVSYQSDRGSSFIVQDLGTKLDLSRLQELSTRTDSGGNLGVYADNGAEISLSALPQIIQGSVQFSANGEGSRIDLSALVRLSGGYLGVSERGVIAAAALQRLSLSTLSIGARSVLALPNLETFDFCSVNLSGGASWGPPSRISKFAVNGSSFSVSGAETLLDFSGITEMTSGGSGANVSAGAGGEIRLPSLSRILSGPGYFSAFGEGSHINLSALESLEGGRLAAESLGTIDAGVAVAKLTAENISVEVAKGGRIRSGNLVVTGASQLSGDGRLVANVELEGSFKSAGVFNPLTVEGDFTVRPSSRLEFIVTGTETPAEHVQLVVTGRATLDGTLGITPQNPALFEINDGFRLMSWTSHTGEFRSFTDLSAGTQQEFVPVYSNDHLSLKVTPSLPPSVVGIQPATPVAGNLDQITVLFSEPVDPATFLAEDVVLVGPDGTAIPVNAPSMLDARAFRVTFESQSAVGSYQVTLGPDVADYANNPMAAAQSFSVRIQPVQGGPAITTPPVSRVVGSGTAVVLSVGASPEGGLSYQWRLNGEAIPGAMGASYAIPAADAASAGRYTVVVTNEAGSVESAPASVSLFDVATFVGTVVTGPTGATYRIEFREALDLEDAWQVATTLTLATSPTIWIDQDSPKGARRFYRAVPVNP